MKPSYLSERHGGARLFGVPQVYWEGHAHLVSFTHGPLPHLQALPLLQLHLSGALRVQEVERAHRGLGGRGRTQTPVRQESGEGKSGAVGGRSPGGESSEEA